jgi:hypothetical protein
MKSELISLIMALLILGYFFIVQKNTAPAPTKGSM